MIACITRLPESERTLTQDQPSRLVATCGAGVTGATASFSPPRYFGDSDYGACNNLPASGEALSALHYLRDCCIELICKAELGNNAFVLFSD